MRIGTDACARTAPTGVARKTVHDFARDEDGALYIFGIYVFIMILMLGGIGIDLMHHERDRSEMQSTLDRAVLAAADLDQTQDPKAVVLDYFEKAGLGDSLGTVTVSEGLGYRVVSAEASAVMGTQFMHMAGIDELSAQASSTAEERIGSVEISLILDVSGSMNSNSRLTNLKVAAQDFVDNMVDNTEAGSMSMSIIPYATQVSLPDEVMAEFNVSTEHSYSNCINFDASAFNSTSVSTTTAYQRTMHFDPWNTSDKRDDDPVVLVEDPVCEADDSREMLVMQNDRDVLKNFISALTAEGNTSIDLGMKWGTSLLDPDFRTVANQLATGGHIPADFSNRPYNYDSGEALKVVVLMTDGQNTSQYYVENGFREGPSDIWWNDDEERYSVWYDGYSAYYWPHSNQWADHPYGQDGYGCVGTYYYSMYCSNRTYTGTAERLNYPDLWAYTPLYANAKDNYFPFMNDSTARSLWYYDVFGYVGSSTKNSRTYDICDAAKAQDIIVFTIGFEAPYSGRTVLQNCASSDVHFFDVDGLEISDAFESIATSIRKLRLTQ